jgi:partner of Y14 and mago protein
MDSNALPKGHIIGWTPPPAATKPGGSGSAPLSKNAKKRQKQKEKKAEAIKDNWEDEDEGAQEPASTKKTASTSKAPSEAGKGNSGTHTPDHPNWAVAPAPEMTDDGADGLASKLEKLEVQ